MSNIEQIQNDYNAAIEFALTTDDGIEFLRCWNEGAWRTCEDEFGFKVSDHLKFPIQPTAVKPHNTTVTIKYSNGSTREFVASDELEKSINEGEMFSVTSMHSDMGIDEEMAVSKMYVGNPLTAMGNMIIMKRNAEMMPEDIEGGEHKGAIIDVLTSCIAFMAEEITSHQSNMSPVPIHDYQQKAIDDVRAGDTETEGRCKICGAELNNPLDPASKDCGGDCLKCMSESGDPYCIAEMERIHCDTCSDSAECDGGCVDGCS